MFAPPLVLLAFARDALLFLAQGFLGGIGAGAQAREVGFLQGGKLVGVDHSTGLLQSVDGRVEAIGDEEGACLFCFLFGVLKWRRVGWGKSEHTFLGSWNPTCPVAMEAFLCKFDQGV